MSFWVTLLFGLFLMVHGLIHLLWVAPIPEDPKFPFTLARSPWFPGRDGDAALRTAGTVLVYLAVAEFVAAGLGVMGVPLLASVWRIMAVVAALDSMLVNALFWNRQLLLGPILDVLIIVAAVMGWPRP